MTQANQLALTAAALTQGLNRVNNLEWLGVNAEHQAIWRVDTDRLLVITAHTGSIDASGLPRSLFRFQLGETQGADYDLLPDL